jgi:ribosomal protein S18 acetylase RimI-like enzyme
MAVTVRTAQPADFGTIGRLTVAAYRADGQLHDENGYERVLADVAARAEDGTVVVAVDDETGRLLGAVTVVLPGSRYAELSGDGEAELRMLAVDPDAQGRGVGEILVRACLRHAADLGRRAVVVSCPDVALPAQRLYARLGFRRLPALDWSPVPGVRLQALRFDLTGGSPCAGPGPPKGGARAGS